MIAPIYIFTKNVQGFSFPHTFFSFYYWWFQFSHSVMSDSLWPHGLQYTRLPCPKYWSFSFSISPSKEHPGLIFRMDWLDLFAVQGTLKSLLQHHSSKVSILWHSAFFMVQLSHPYMTTGKTTALTRRTFVSKVKSLLFNSLCCLCWS